MFLLAECCVVVYIDCVVLLGNGCVFNLLLMIVLLFNVVEIDSGDCVLIVGVVIGYVVVIV